MRTTWLVWLLLAALLVGCSGRTVRSAPQENKLRLSQLSVADVASVEVSTKDPGVRPITIQPANELVLPLIEALQTAQTRPRNVGTTPSFSVLVRLVSGSFITLDFTGSQPLMATIDGDDVWIDGPYLMAAVKPLGKLIGKSM